MLPPAHQAAPVCQRSSPGNRGHITVSGRTGSGSIRMSAREVRYALVMAKKYPRVREQHIAVFGESGSGKTVLVSSFFGHTQEGAYQNDLWDLVADDIGQSTRLFKQYLGMRDRGMTPLPTRFEATTYYF